MNGLTFAKVREDFVCFALQVGVGVSEWTSFFFAFQVGVGVSEWTSSSVRLCQSGLRFFRTSRSVRLCHPQCGCVSMVRVCCVALNGVPHRTTPVRCSRSVDWVGECGWEVVEVGVVAGPRARAR